MPEWNSSFVLGAVDNDSDAVFMSVVPFVVDCYMLVTVYFSESFRFGDNESWWLHTIFVLLCVDTREIDILRDLCVFECNELRLFDVRCV